MRNWLQQGLWLHTATAGMRPVSLRWTNGLVAAMLSRRRNELYPATLYTAGRMHCPRQSYLPSLAARLYLLGQLHADLLSLPVERSICLRHITVLTVSCPEQTSPRSAVECGESREPDGSRPRCASCFGDAKMRMPGFTPSSLNAKFGRL
jgi:hypothetical protein